jgi:hypothetical protein
MVLQNISDNPKDHNLNITGVIKSRRIEWVGECSTHETDEKCIQNFGWKDHLEDLGTDGRITLQ